MLGPSGLPMPMNTVTPVSTAQVVSLQGSGKVMAEYIWLGQGGADLKSRTVVLDEQPSCADDLPIAEIDGSSYGQAAEESCEIYLQPKKIFPDPFRGGNHILVLCDTYVPPLACSPVDPWENMQPHISNHRAACEQVMKQAAHHQPVFTMQQEYTLVSDGCSSDGSGGFTMGCMPVPTINAPGLSDKASARLGREVSELHMRACLSAGLSYSGSCATSTHQYAFKLGPCLGVDMGDQLSMSRFLLHRIAEHSEADVFYDSLCKPGCTSSGNRCIVQFSTATSRDPTSGLSAVQDMMEQLHSCQAATLATFGSPSGVHSGCSWHSCSGFSEQQASGAVGRFTTGLSNNYADVMVPTSTLLNKCGPILDRRPPASSDPYLTTMLLVASACGVPLPRATRSAMHQAAMQLAACQKRSAGMAIPSSQRHTHSHHSFGMDGCGSAAPSCSYGSLGGLSSLSGSADSQDVLLSALDRLDGLSPTAPITMAGSMGYADDDDCSICSDASSPPLAAQKGHQTLAAAIADEMFYE